MAAKSVRSLVGVQFEIRALKRSETIDHVPYEGSMQFRREFWCDGRNESGLDLP